MSLQDDRQIITMAYFQAINQSNQELFNFCKTNFEEVKSVFPLVEFIIERLATVTQLASQKLNWDSEIIYRSALEAFIKLTFICTVKGEEREKRLQEYWNDLREINSLRQSEQAKQNLKLYGNDEVLRVIYSPMLLADENELALRQKWDRSTRKMLEHKWTFTEIIFSLSKNYFGKPEPYFLGLCHDYRNASHVTHADETGVLIIKERSARNKDEQDIVDLVHTYKLMSTTFTICMTMGIYLYSFTNASIRFFSELNNSLEEVNKIGDKYLVLLQQDQVYDKFKRPGETE